MVQTYLSNLTTATQRSIRQATTKMQIQIQLTASPSSPILISSPTNQYTIRLYDYDGLSANDYMGGWNFTPYGGGGFPSSIYIGVGNLQFTLECTYTW